MGTTRMATRPTWANRRNMPQAPQPPNKSAFNEAGQPLPGPEVVRLIRSEVDHVLLSFSCGKDSIAAWLAIRDQFAITPFYLELIPGLSFIEESLRYYERYFGSHIIRVTHPSLYRMLNHFVFQPPERVAVIRAAKLPNFDHDMVAAMVAIQAGLVNPYVISGVRAADSPNRRTSINKYGPVNWKRRMVYPIWDMKMDQLLALLAKSKVALPIDYRLFGRSYDGLDFRFVVKIRDHYPADYQKILDWFPLVELELWRYERGELPRWPSPRLN